METDLPFFFAGAGDALGILGSAELFWLVAALNVGCFAVVANLVHSRFGRALTAVRDNDAAGSASGVSLVRMKLFAFVLSAAITGWRLTPYYATRRFTFNSSPNL